VLLLVWTMRVESTRAFDASAKLAKRYLMEKGF
jgi:hypothetical protein